MLDINEDATWIDVWFTEGSAKCVLSANLIEMLDEILAGNYHFVATLLCIDGATVHVRGSYIQGYYINKPEQRERRFGWEKVLARFEERIKKDDWD